MRRTRERAVRSSQYERGFLDYPVLLVFLPAFVLSLVILTALYVNVQRNEREAYELRLRSEATLLRETLSRFVESTVADISFLASEERVRVLLEDGEIDPDAARGLLGLFLGSRREYRSVELYDLNLERPVSVYAPAGARSRSPFVADDTDYTDLPLLPDDDVDESFALDVLTLPRGAVAVSAMTAAERADEEPARHFVRIGMPVPGDAGHEAIGAVVVSVYVDSLAEKIGSLFGAGEARAIIRDEDGTRLEIDASAAYRVEDGPLHSDMLGQALAAESAGIYVGTDVAYAVMPFYGDQIGTTAAAREVPALGSHLAGRREGGRWMLASVREAETLQLEGMQRGFAFLAIALGIAAALGLGTFAVARVNRGRLAARRSLERALSELSVHNRELRVLNAMAEAMQACADEEEIYSTIGTYITDLFPSCSGALHVFDGDAGELRAVWRWGEPLGGDSFTAGECWALRHGGSYVSRPNEPEPICLHLADHDGHEFTICCPLIASGESFGVLSVNRKLTEEHDDLERAVGEVSGLAETVAARTAVNLANLKLRSSLLAQSIRDPLTGLFNRRYLEETLERETQRATRTLGSVGVIMFDIDHFKKLNDRYGHAVGDRVLKEVADVAQSLTRSEDVVCRYGGEEFTVVMPGAEDAAVDRAEQLRTAIESAYVEHDGSRLSVTSSFGVATFPRDGLNAESVLRAADSALYDSKKGGRNRVTVAGAGQLHYAAEADSNSGVE